MAKGAQVLGGSTAADKKEQDKWMAESDLRTLIEAEKIKGDAERLKRAMACKKDQMAALKKVGE